jgi:hypothetical protein
MNPNIETLSDVFFLDFPSMKPSFRSGISPLAIFDYWRVDMNRWWDGHRVISISMDRLLGREIVVSR